MPSVFSHIIQKRFSQVNEDVATDALAYILESSEAAQRGMTKLLRGIIPDLPQPFTGKLPERTMAWKVSPIHGVNVLFLGVEWMVWSKDYLIVPTEPRQNQNTPIYWASNIP